jgi:hypothetical protein
MEGMVCCTPRQPPPARSSTAHTSDRHAGEAADDLHPPAGLAEGALDEGGVVVSLLGHTALQQQLAMAVAEHVREVSPDNERGGNR